MNFLQDYVGKMKGMNGTADANGMPSQGDQELNQRLMQNTMTAHHTGDGMGLDGFKDITLEGMIDLVKEGKLEKEVLGDNADELLRNSNKQTGTMEIPVIPFDASKQFLNDFRTPPG